MKKITFLMVALLATMFTSATPLVTWDVQNNTGWLTSLPAATTDPSVVVTDILVGSGLTGSGTAAGYSFGGSVVTANANTLTTAITNNSFFTMTVQAAAGQTMSLTGFSTWFTRKSGTGTTQIVVQYSLDGTTFTDAGTVTVTSTGAPGSDTPLLFSQAARTALTNVPSTTTVTLRFVVVSTVNASIYLVAGNATNMTKRMVLESTVFQPEVAAPVPTQPVANVKSIYSDAYTAATTVAYGSWGQSTVRTTFTITGDNMLKLTNFNYLGFELNSNNDVDFSTMEYLHVDVWTPNGTKFQITPIWHNSSGATTDALYTCTPYNQGTWNSYDIPLTSFSAIEKARVFQLKIVGEPTSTCTAFVDNIYFWGTGTKVATPVITPAVGYFDAPVNVTIACAESGANIYYTTDGSAPSATSISSTLYSGVFQVNAPATVKAYAVKSGMNDSEVATANYYVKTDPLLIDDLEGANKGWNTVSSYEDVRSNAYPDCLNPSAKVLYTQRAVANDNWSGAILSGAGFGGPITGYQYLKAKMYRNNTNVPNVKVTDATTVGPTDIIPMSNITIVANQWQDVVFDLAGRSLDYVFFMVDRSSPLAADAWMLVDDIVLSNDPTPRVCLQQVATPVISPAGGNVSAPVTVSITCTESNASIYYSTDGSTPSATSSTSTLYSTPLNITTTTTVKAIAVKAGMTDSGVASETYTFVAPTPLVKWDFASMPGGTGNFGTSPLTPTISNVNLTVVGLTRNWTPLTSGSGAAAGWGGNNFTATSMAAAITANEFVTFSLTPNTNYYLSLSSIGAYNVRRSGTGPTTGQWQYAIGTGSFTNIGSAITWGTITTAVGNPQASIDLSAISDLQNIAAGTTVTFRLVLWGATGTGGTFYFNDSPQAAAVLGLPIFGTVTLITNTDFNLNNSIKIYSNNGNIIIDNAKAGQYIEVYNVAGQLLVSKVATEGTNTVSSVSKGMLIVRCGEKVGKIIL